jgi:hypothetical protein
VKRNYPTVIAETWHAEGARNLIASAPTPLSRMDPFPSARHASLPVIIPLFTANSGAARNENPASPDRRGGIQILRSHRQAIALEPIRLIGTSSRLRRLPKESVRGKIFKEYRGWDP